MLTVFEELLLLSLHESKCTFIKSAIEPMKVGLVGAILAELALLNNIKATDNHRLQLNDPAITEDKLLKEVLGTLKGAEKARKFGYWLDNLNLKPDKTRTLVTERLILKGILIQEEDHLQWVIPSPLQAKVKATTKYWVVRRLQGIVLALRDVELRDIALLSLLKACGLLELVFLNDEIKLADRYIYELVVSKAMNDPVIQTIQEIESAMANIIEED